jgi:hypothetical protein
MCDYDDAYEARRERMREWGDDGEPRRKLRRARGCWCQLDGYPGHCPGPENCPYSGYHDEERDDD